MPSKADDGTPFTAAKELPEAWTKFMGKKFECADLPGAVYNPGIN